MSKKLIGSSVPSSTSRHWMSQCGCIWHMSVSRFCPLRNLNLRDANARLQTFQLLNWPTTLPVKPVELAEAGFYYTGQNDSVRCFHCNVGIYDWKEGDDVAMEHIKFSRNCLFTLGSTRTGNVPIIENPYAEIKGDIQYWDVTDC